MIKVLCVFGTRPEAIKFAPLILAFNKHPAFHASVCITGQHKEMLQQALSLFDIRPDFDLNIMKQDQTLTSIARDVLSGVDEVMNRTKPDYVFVQGDTTTAMAASLTAFYQQIPVCHIEAGLRSGNVFSPWPEEANRRICDTMTSWFFAPTEQARQHLLTEGYADERIIVTGNTVIDALKLVEQMLRDNASLRRATASGFPFLDPQKQLILITGHRRESFGEQFEQFCTAIYNLAKDWPDTQFVYPVHLNPHVQLPVHRMLKGVTNIHLIDPQEYLPFIYLMSQACLVITDSGGVQEEAPSLGKPVLVTRDTTERPEAMMAGTAKLVGTNTDSIVQAVNLLLNDNQEYRRMAVAHNPYGDGRACDRILGTLLNAHCPKQAASDNQLAQDVVPTPV